MVPVMTDLTAEGAEAYADALADVICWLYGFQAAKPEGVNLPPRWREMISLSARLREHASEKRCQRVSP